MRPELLKEIDRLYDAVGSIEAQVPEGWSEFQSEIGVLRESVDRIDILLSGDIVLRKSA